MLDGRYGRSDDAQKAESFMPSIRIYRVSFRHLEAIHSVLPVSRLVPNWGENAAWKAYLTHSG